MMGRMKKLVAMLLCVVMTAAFVPAAFGAEETEESTITRSEWIARIVETFSMTIENDDNMPDNYYSDLTEDMDCYYNILVATEFGIIDLEAGEAFCPGDAATREFAAQTLNFALLFQLDEDAEYTFAEYETVTYPDDIQVAINRGWFALEDGYFLPDAAITEAESEAMLAEAADVIESDKIDPDYVNTYKFADGVIEVPQGTDIEFDGDTVTIYDPDVAIEAGDIFVVYNGTLAVALVALEVESIDGAVVITATDEGAEDAITYADAQGSIAIDVADFEFDEVTTFSIMNKETNESEDMTLTLMDIDYDANSKTVTATKKITVGSSLAGTLSVKLKNLDIDWSVNPWSPKVIVSADTVVSTSIDFDFGSYTGIPSTLELGSVPVFGIGKISVNMQYSITGGITLAWEGTLRAGVSYYGGDMHFVSEYTKDSFSFYAEVTLKVGARIQATVSILGAIKGSIWASAGVKCTAKATPYTDGKKPELCLTTKAYLYAEIGVSLDINVIVYSGTYKKTYEIWSETTSPVRTVSHYEDGVTVSTCTRGEDLTYVTSPWSKYYLTLRTNSSGSYSYTDGSGSTVVVVTWEYTLDDLDNATITAYHGNASAVAIPTKIDGYTVTAIGDRAFSGNTNIISLSIPNTVTTIGVRAFSDCTKLSSVTLSKNLTTLYQLAFCNCTSLTEIEIPKSLISDSASWGAFQNSGLKTVTFEEGTKEVIDSLFSNAINLENVTLLDSMTKIGDGAFSGCTSLSNITIPDSVIEIGGSAFSGCTSLSNITIPDSVTEIGVRAFYGCTILSSVTLSKNLTRLYQLAFCNCTSLTEIEIPKSLISDSASWGAFQNSGLKTVTFEEGTREVIDSLFSGAIKLENVTLLDTMTKIGSSAFSGCTSLSNITIPDSVIEIGTRAFSGCTKLSSVTLSKNLTTLYQLAFCDCTSLTEIEIPKSLVSDSASWGAFQNSGLKTVTFEEGTREVIDSLFRDAINLESVTLIDTMTKIGNSAFSGCTSLQNITIPDTIVTISDSAFYNCTNLIEISIPDSVTSMGTSTFYGCTSLTKATLPSMTTEVKSNTFYNCSSLTDIVLPDSVTTISSSAFEGCAALESINLHDNIVKIDSYAFKNSGLMELVISENVTWVGYSAFYNCDNLTDVTIYMTGNLDSYAFYDCDSLVTVTAEMNGTIGSSAFYDCDALQTLILGDGVTEIGSSMCYDCDSLSEVVFGKYVAAIPDSAFRLLPKLTSVTLPRFCESVAANAFSENTKLVSVYLPSTVASIETSSFSYPSKMTFYGRSGSYAEEYADGRNIKFVDPDAPIESMSYAESTIAITRGSTVRPEFEIEPEFDTSIITFSSSDESVATVSASGAVYAKGYGTAVITAESSEGVSASIEVLVPKAVTSIKLSQTELSLVEFDTAALTATISPSDYSDVLTWESSDENVAAVDENGTVTALGAGEATITLSALYGGISASCTVTVTPAEDGIKSVSAVREGDKVTMTIQCKNTSGARVFAVGFSGNEMIDVKEPENGSAELDAKTETIKVFMWEGFGSMRPVGGVFEITVE